MVILFYRTVSLQIFYNIPAAETVNGLPRREIFSIRPINKGPVSVLRAP